MPSSVSGTKERQTRMGFDLPCAVFLNLFSSTRGALATETGSPSATLTEAPAYRGQDAISLRVLPSGDHTWSALLCLSFSVYNLPRVSGAFPRTLLTLWGRGPVLNSSDVLAVPPHGAGHRVDSKNCLHRGPT